MTGGPLLFQQIGVCVSTWTVDLGVESGIHKIKSCSFRDAFPYLSNDGNEDVGPEHLGTKLSMEGSIVIGGGLRLTSNTMKGMLLAMPRWD